MKMYLTSSSNGKIISRPITYNPFESSDYIESISKKPNYSKIDIEINDYEWTVITNYTKMTEKEYKDLQSTFSKIEEDVIKLKEILTNLKQYIDEKRK